MVTVQEVKDILEKHVEDPELGIDIVTLELVYDVKIIDLKNCEIVMTFTSPMCPYGPQLVADVEAQLKHHLEFENVKVEVVFEPRWKPSDELKAALGIGGGM